MNSDYGGDKSIFDESFDPNSTNFDMQLDDLSLSCLYAFGKNEKGELSLKNTKNVLSPTPVDRVRNKKIVFVSSGGDTSAVIDSTGILYMCGSTLHNKLGIEVNVRAVTTFKHFPLSKEYKVR